MSMDCAAQRWIANVVKLGTCTRLRQGHVECNMARNRESNMATMSKHMDPKFSGDMSDFDMFGRRV